MQRQRRTYLLELTLVVFLLLQSPSVLRADNAELFSVNYDTDELVAIDSATGEVRVVGPLGIDIYNNVNLTYYDGLLYGLHSVYQQRVELFRIDPPTGAASIVVPVTNDGQGIISAEGLASLGNELVIGFHLNGGDTWSDALALVDPTDGTISNVVSYPADTTDFDGLTADEMGVAEFLSVDSHSPASIGNGSLFRVNRAPPQYNAVIVPFATGLVNDLAFLESRLYVLEQETPALIELDPMTGDVLQTIPIIPEGAYRGLAAIPEPSTVASLLSLVVAVFLAHARRQRRRAT